MPSASTGNGDRLFSVAAIHSLASGETEIMPAGEGSSLAGDPCVDSNAAVLAAGCEFNATDSAPEKGAQGRKISKMASAVRNRTFILISVR